MDPKKQPHKVFIKLPPNPTEADIHRAAEIMAEELAAQSDQNPSGTDELDPASEDSDDYLSGAQ